MFCNSVRPCSRNNNAQPFCCLDGEGSKAWPRCPGEKAELDRGHVPGPHGDKQGSMRTLTPIITYSCQFINDVQGSHTVQLKRKLQPCVHSFDHSVVCKFILCK